ncbi:hypothetical protein [Streptomyces spectabilis]|uniref:DUF4034 domain-containing protein n=1 Tax=Streptomyces spectabilis TaxID=68270 RepID=A0A5P2XIW1_STRST|nr:hypothetical protein [Streptomyces spectabilis]MBB5105595.1 hypothetical protein [Streptomyces spectabilis]MCI3906780.1 hypothetical protein [Streptomyces spectabilis]QEV63584.1 hypothetical protein CP982_36830 [Streptomyces spectabilis]GGV22636.1 hypothetical protein GCM10010245_38000 [Streptomyces spectabilis]
MAGANPAGRDTDLYAAVQDIQAGYWMQMRQVLARTGTWPQWTSRTQVLGIAAAQNNVVELWLEEEPWSLAARVMYARVATERVLQAHRRHWAHDSKQARDLERLADRARQACDKAGEGNPDDVVPWICRLALAETDTQARHPEHHMAPPPHEYLLPHGPWGLLGEAHRRDPFNREAWHRMSQALQARPGPAGRQAVAMDFARWTVSFAPSDSPLLLLPLYVRVQEHREQLDKGAEVTLNLLWTREDTTRAVTQAFEGWFQKCDPATSSQLDLNYLAYALSRGGFAQWATEVFDAIGEFATPAPWQYDARHPRDQWRKAFEEDRYACLRSRPRPTGNGT